MCGIVGLFLKDNLLESELGGMLSQMLITMTDRGPDSAGIAVYGGGDTDRIKVSIQSENPDGDFDALSATLLEAIGDTFDVERKSTHAIYSFAKRNLPTVKSVLRERYPNLTTMSSGQTMEIFKEVGLPKDVVSRFGIDEMTGTHGIGHTRMATESAVTTNGAHPFSTGADQCLVHNGSLSNHNNLRRELTHNGIALETQNDSEVAAAYLTWRMQSGANLGEALEASLADLDGFFTFVVGTKDGFGVLRDPIACKPAVLAETDQYVAFGSEYRALADLPGIGEAHIWEPEPATVYFWER
ncbi:MAG: glutamine amidotransferase family protein [Pseudomonadota bacterium]